MNQRADATERPTPGQADIVCPLCGTLRIRPLFVKEAIRYFACETCDFVFSTPARNVNLEHALADFEPSYLQYLAEDPRDAKNFAALIRWISRFCNLQRGKVLDLGCGSGKLVRHLHARGVDIQGLEGSRALYEHFLADDPRFLYGTVEETLDGVYDEFEVVLALDVIEHVPTPVETLAAVSRLLKPGGWLFVTTPDTGSIPARLLGRRWHFFHEYHLSYWTRQTLTAAAARHAFAVRYFGHRWRYHSAGYALSYLYERILRRQSPSLFRYVDRLHLPLNLFDVMYLAFEKETSRTCRTEAELPFALENASDRT